jgi:enoyl-CoA hydratase
MQEPIDVREDGGVVVITINREARRNALNDPALLRIQQAVRETPSGSPIVITGAGTRAFSSWSDVKELAQQTPRQRLAHTALGQSVVEQLEEHPGLVIAAIEGYCLGGGLEFALACDVRVAGASSSFGLPEVRINALPTWGGTFRLARVVGVGRAKEVILLSRMVGAEQALAWGIVAEVVEDGGTLSRAMAIARELVDADNGGALSLAKALIGTGVGLPTRSARQLEYLADAAQTASEDFERGVGNFGGESGGSG